MTRELIVVGDKVLIEPDEGKGRTDAGLYLPDTVKEKEKVHSGRVIKTGPGYPVPDPHFLDQEPWMKSSKERYFPLQIEAGDYCVFLRDQAVEVEFERKKYVVVPNSAILLISRDNQKESFHEI